MKVRLYRPFSAEHLLAAIPETVKKIAVLDRTKEPGSEGEPLYMDVVTALANANRFNDMNVIGGRYGLGSKDTPPASVFAVYDELKDAPKHKFTLGIVDDVTHLSLEEKAVPGAQISKSLIINPYSVITEVNVSISTISTSTIAHCF